MYIIFSHGHLTLKAGSGCRFEAGTAAVGELYPKRGATPGTTICSALMAENSPVSTEEN